MSNSLGYDVEIAYTSPEFPAVSAIVVPRSVRGKAYIDKHLKGDDFTVLTDTPFIQGSWIPRVHGALTNTNYKVLVTAICLDSANTDKSGKNKK